MICKISWKVKSQTGSQIFFLVHIHVAIAILMFELYGGINFKSKMKNKYYTLMHSYNGSISKVSGT